MTHSFNTHERWGNELSPQIFLFSFLFFFFSPYFLASKNSHMYDNKNATLQVSISQHIIIILNLFVYARRAYEYNRVRRVSVNTRNVVKNRATVYACVRVHTLKKKKKREKERTMTYLCVFVYTSFFFFAVPLFFFFFATSSFFIAL